MGKIGKCCCGDCETCTELAGVTNWTINTPLFGFTTSGTFGDLVTGVCKKFGNDCERLDNILEDDYEISSDWAGWLNLWACNDSCIDCTDPEDPINLPPCTTDIFGNVSCPPGYPTYPGEQYSVRGSLRFRFWYSKMVWVEVEIRYVTPTTVKFFVYASFSAGAALTYARRTQRRRRTVEYECTSNILRTTGTPTDPGSVSAPEPLEPCVSLLTDSFTIGNCEDPEFNVEPDPCETESTSIIEYSCTEVVGGVCVSVDYEVSLVTSETTQCCDSGFFCPPIEPQEVTFIYESTEYNCDEVPSSIPLDIVGTESDMIVSWPCENIDTPADVVLTIPSTITLSVS
jgi:hypothetical protein